MAQQCYTESLEIASLCEQCKSDPTSVAHANHEEITDLDPRSDSHDERPSPVDELDDLQIGKLPGQSTKISRQLTPELRQQLEAEILKNADLFAWSSANMSGIDADFICHKLAIHKEAKPVAQWKRKVGDERREAIVAEAQKLLNAGFMSEVRYTTWLANVVLVKKNSGKWRMCVDYTDLNKACPKDSHPLPSIDRLISSFDEFTIKHVPREQNARADLLSKLASTKRPGQHRTIIQETLHSPSLDDKVVNVSDNEDLGWMAGIWNYLKEGTLPEAKDEARKIRMRLAKEIHQGICGMHSGARSMATRVLRAGYYWPTLKSNCQSYIQKCKEC
uniref:Transposon Ty3-G Gag-Pol polyprotein n=1 Tax=Cajanus cajan TaxID=3821 RepID=A0A151UDF3_CAJCA